MTPIIHGNSGGYQELIGKRCIQCGYARAKWDGIRLNDTTQNTLYIDIFRLWFTAAAKNLWKPHPTKKPLC